VGSGLCQTRFVNRQDGRSMNRLHIVGRKNHGKTTLIADLVVHLTGQGLSVATIKHTHHAHELDTPGKDSFLHRQAGANVVGIVARNLSAAFWPTPDRDSESSDQYGHFEKLTTACDLVLVEGDQHTKAAKIEVWRASVGSAPLAAEDDSILAVVSDDPAPITCRIYPRRDLSLILTAIQDLWRNKSPGT
jgi:molybdopterin-guanine dinucleotide biosynthesis adapter protein